MIKVNAIKCKNCGDTIYSRAVHDFHFCSCEKCAIDGGFEYTRILGNPEDYENVIVELDADRKSLYLDWAKGIDKFGIIKTEKEN